MNIFCVDHLPREIPVGYQTEHGVERVGFDVSTWIRKWPGMGFQLWASVPGTDTSYPAKSTREGNILFWDVGLADTAVAGRGVVEVVGLADGVKKIARADTLVRASTTAEPGDVPDVHQPWVDQVLDAAVRAEEAAKRAEEAEGGGISFEVDETLTLANGILSVNTTDAATKDDARPITSQGVYNEFAVINALLKTI